MIDRVMLPVVLGESARNERKPLACDCRIFSLVEDSNNCDSTAAGSLSEDLLNLLEGVELSLMS